MQRKLKNKTDKIDFYVEFAAELDIFDSTLSVPSWTFDYREQLIRKLTGETRRICRFVKSLGLAFKIKWPIEINGTWKYADLYFPRQRTVVIVNNPMNDHRPCCMPSYRAEFFRERYRVVEIETVADLKRLMARKKAV
jgi:hypothetical protein